MANDRKHSTTLSASPIAERLVAKMKREVRGKVVNIKDVIASRDAAEELQRTVVTKEGLAGYHPAHAAYIYAQNQSSVMSEQLTALAEVAPFADIFTKAEDLFMPGGPPMSPLTASYFTCWAFFDACERHMKYGPTRTYWDDFVFESYVNHRTEVIYLAGLPDVPESRPHSQVNGWGFGR